MTRGEVVEHQCGRLLRAVPAAVCAKGFAAMTVEDICARAGVSRRTFYENFRDREDCFIASYRLHTEELTAVVAGAASAGGDWQERARVALGRLLRYLGERPEVAHMGLVEVMAAGPRALAERDQTVALLTSLIGEDALAVAETPAPRLLLHTIAGSALHLIYTWTLAGRAQELERLLPAVMYMVLVALHGPHGAAARAGLISTSMPARVNVTPDAAS